MLFRSGDGGRGCYPDLRYPVQLAKRVQGLALADVSQGTLRSFLSTLDCVPDNGISVCRLVDVTNHLVRALDPNTRPDRVITGLTTRKVSTVGLV